MGYITFGFRYIYSRKWNFGKQIYKNYNLALIALSFRIRFAALQEAYLSFGLSSMKKSESMFSSAESSVMFMYWES
jgi:hypothetical protein